MLRNAFTQARDKGSVFLNSIHLPERFKGTMVEKWAKYWEGLLTDYGEVIRDTFSDIQQRPLRAAFIAAAGGLGAASVRFNPTEIDYRAKIVDARDEVALVSTTVRNPSANLYVNALEALYNEKRIRRLSLGIMSFYWVADWSTDLGHIKAQCDYLKPKLLTWHQRVIEVGFWNRFWALEKALKDYDINPAEWAAEDSVEV